MKSRITITLVWFCGLCVMLVGVEVFYFNLLSRDGLAYLSSELRLETFGPLLAVYGVYLGGILGFWYAQPFRPLKIDRREPVRVGLALATTLLLNVTLLYFVFRARFFHPVLAHADIDVLADIKQGVKITGLLSFLVAPVNFYYFGVRPTHS